jgi:hypothetical protein
MSSQSTILSLRPDSTELVAVATTKISPRPSSAPRSVILRCAMLPGWSSSPCMERIEARIASTQPRPVNSRATAEIRPMVPAFAISASMSILSPTTGRFSVSACLSLSTADSLSSLPTIAAASTMSGNIEMNP